MERSERQKIQLATNQPYDESFEVNAEEAASVHTPSPRQIVSRRTGRQKQSAMATYAGNKLEEDTKIQLATNQPYDESFEVNAEEAASVHTPSPRQIVSRRTGRQKQSAMATYAGDPTVLSLWLSENSKQHNVAEVKVKSIENPEKNPKAIDNWIESISELHRSKPPATVHYTRPMPDIDSLMQEWPPEFEELLGKVNLPTADIDCDLAEYVDIMCGILDIPVYKNRIYSLHVLFTLYSEFKNSQHFKSVAEGQKSDTPPASRTATAELERLTLD
ncbi:intraflagellar transport protein 46 homolog [Sinocyclocheilus grahami]|uniref:intraflagellar transport protein 46 homolog n=1 Tax=Sinocyclocheilus grahami TaxID=75366 RepID=UPI0007AC639C|nr:PREDICTED: intraflagellar transport protein 46 homolog [Sinocyclocheilus grahami]